MTDEQSHSPGAATTEYVVVLRAKSAARFLPEEGWLLQLNAPSLGVIGATLRSFTRWELVGDHSFPRELILEVTLAAEAIDEAIVKAGQLARPVATMAGFVANVFVGPLDVHLAFERQARNVERGFLEVFLPDERGPVSDGRIIRQHLMVAATQALMTMPTDYSRVDRALRQYELALREWRLGGEYLALAHLWIAAENLTNAVARKTAADRGMSVEQLAESFGVVTDDPERPRWREVMGASVRQSIIFDGDLETYSAATKASNGFEHGFMELDQVAAHALLAAAKTFRYVRRAILDLLELPDEVHSELLEISPKDTQSHRKIIRGRLLGTADDPAQADQLYPLLEWRSSVSEVVREGAAFQFKAKERVTVRTHPEISFRMERLEIRGRLEDGQAPVEVSNIDAAFDYAPPSKAAALVAATRSIVDGVAEAVAATPQTNATLKAFELFGQGFALFETVQALLDAHLPVEALLPLRALACTAARFEFAASEGSGGLGVFLRLALDALDQIGASDEIVEPRRHALLQRAQEAGLTVPETLPPPDESPIYNHLAVEMQFAVALQEGTFGAIPLHMTHVEADRLGFITRLGPGPLAEMVSTAAVWAMLELLTGGAKLLGWTIDHAEVEALLADARAENEAAAGQDLLPTGSAQAW